jgi:hypothetical protein
MPPTTRQILLLIDNTEEAAAVQQMMAEHFPQLTCDIITVAHLPKAASDEADDDATQPSAPRPSDAVSQAVFSAAMMADATLRLWQKNPAAIGSELHHLKAITHYAMTELHRLLFQLARLNGKETVARQRQ